MYEKKKAPPSAEPSSQRLHHSSQRLSRHVVPAMPDENAGSLVHDRARVNAFDFRCNIA